MDLQGCKKIGSPPRVRGTGRYSRGGDYPMRITPACAGNRRRGCEDPVCGEDHPRVCGEQRRIAQLKAEYAGSPPRVRGTVAHCPNCNDRARITPACAGNRAAYSDLDQPHPDHPRVCGEQSMQADHQRNSRGSPPRVRGTGYCGGGDGCWTRITPACAGNRARFVFTC